MNLTHKEVKPYLERFLAKVGEINEVQVVFIPSFTSIPAFADALEESPNFWELGVQDMYWEKGGAFTGEINAQEAHAFIRSVLVSTFDLTTAEGVRIQYGGSVKPENAQELMAQKDVDGALVGGACLDPEGFARIVQCAEKELPTSST